MHLTINRREYDIITLNMVNCDIGVCCVFRYNFMYLQNFIDYYCYYHNIKCFYMYYNGRLEDVEINCNVLDDCYVYLFGVTTHAKNK